MKLGFLINMKNIITLIGILFFFTSSAYACQENMVLKFSDGSTSCIDKTIFINLNTIMAGPFSMEGELKKKYSMPLGVGTNLVVAIPENIKECSPVQVHAGSMWGRYMNRSSSISKCESNTKSTDGTKCSCELIDEIASKLTKEQFNSFQFDYAKAYAKKEKTLLSNVTDLPPLSHTKVMEQSPQILENGGYEDHTIHRRADHRIPQAS